MKIIKRGPKPRPPPSSLTARQRHPKNLGQIDVRKLASHETHSFPPVKGGKRHYE